MAKVLHFIDTSVLRPLQSSSSSYQTYLNANLSEDRYISRYIQKEFTMGLIIPMMNFYCTLRMHHVKNISDALSIWSNRFSVREIKTITSMMSGLLNAHSINFNDILQKDKASIIIADYIYKCIRLLPRRYKFIGTDNDLCSKSNHTFKYDLEELDSLFGDYIIKFKNNDDAKSCNLTKFVNTNSNILEKIREKISAHEPSEKTEYDKWQKILNGLQNPTCPKCAKAGDTIISILSPQNMTIAHTDKSFDLLIPIQGKSQLKLNSESAVSNALRDEAMTAAVMEEE